MDQNYSSVNFVISTLNVKKIVIIISIKFTINKSKNLLATFVGKSTLPKVT